MRATGKPEEPKLDELAQTIGLSPYHLNPLRA
jgi:hypothetical protein